MTQIFTPWWIETGTSPVYFVAPQSILDEINTAGVLRMYNSHLFSAGIEDLLSSAAGNNSNPAEFPKAGDVNNATGYTLMIKIDWDGSSIPGNNDTLATIRMHNDGWTNNTHNWGYLWMRWHENNINCYGNNSFNTGNSTYNHSNVITMPSTGTPEEFIFVVRSGADGRGDGLAGMSVAGYKKWF